MKKLFFFLIVAASASAQSDTDLVGQTLDAWHKAAASANAGEYFGLMTPDAIFIGTDASENWNRDAFMAFAKPFFDKGKAWDFKPVERHIYFNSKKDIAWFDELLDTWMKLCRGSGVLKKEKGHWKIAHYVLSMTVPNDNTDAVIRAKAAYEDEYLKKLKEKK